MMELTVVLLSTLHKIHMKKEKPKQIYEEMGLDRTLKDPKSWDALDGNTEPSLEAAISKHLGHLCLLEISGWILFLWIQ